MMHMELSNSTKTTSFLAGAIRGLIGGIVLGAIVGFLAAGALSFLLPVMAEAGIAVSGLQGFISTTAVAGGPFTAWPLVALNAVLFGVSTAITNGFSKMGAVEQHVQNAVTDQNINILHARGHALEHEVEHLGTRSRKQEQAIHMVAQHSEHVGKALTDHLATTPKHVQQILAEGPRVKVEKPRESHEADIVADRLEEAERTIH